MDVDTAISQLAVYSAAVGLLVAFGFAVPTAVGNLATRRWPFAAVALLMSASLVGMVLHARQDDGYYGDGTSRWEHAGRFMGTGFVAAGLLIGLAGLVVALIALWREGEWRRAVMPIAAVAFLTLCVSWISLTAGH